MRRPSLAISSVLLLTALGAVVACGGGTANVDLAAHAAAAGSGATAASAAPVVPPPPPVRDDGRLPVTVTPQRYAVSLRVDPRQPRFSGIATIQVTVPAPAPGGAGGAGVWHVVVNARDMHVSRAVARVGGAEIPATTTMRLTHDGVVPEEMVLTFARPLPPGSVILEITYDAPFASDLAGLYRVQQGGACYAYTQFEATDARRAFPCFDEPSFKTAYDVTITAPAGMMALANSPEASHQAAPDGMVEHHFETSRPLPSYLVAFAVGDFDVAQGQASPFPIRVVTTKGRSALAGQALEDATALVAELGDYFGVRYPYPKLDLVAVPDFAAGAMENPGLITFRDVRLLLDPQHATAESRRDMALTIAHELSHQWFGDLVTMKWWDDIWLNEGFATWAEAKIVDRWRPSFGAGVEQIAQVQRVMDTDALPSARAVRQPVHSTSDADEAFDGITYDKGAAVLRMLESWLGPDTFRRGIQHYVQVNAWKNASAEDLFKALDYVSTTRVDQVASSFLDRPGVPSVFVSWNCKGKEPNKLELRQSEWRPLGEPERAPRTWRLPVCVATDLEKSKSCFTIAGEPITRDLGPRCPSWVYPNADEAGYYRFVMDRPQLLALARGAHTLDPMDRLGFLSNAWADVRQGALEPGALLGVLPMFDGDSNRYVVETIGSILSGVDDALVEDGARASFRRYAVARMAARKGALGWEPARGAREDDDRALERHAVLWSLGFVGGDKATLSEAERYAQKWLADPMSVPEDTAAVAVPIASIEAGQYRIEQLLAALKNARTPDDRVIAVRALGAFEDPIVLRKALDLALGDDIRLSELRYLFGTVLGHRAARPVLYQWEKDNWAKLRARLPGFIGRDILIRVAGTTCTAPDRDDAKSFFASHTQGIEGVQRPLDEALEQARACVALRDHGAAEVTRYLVGKK